jgi:hypothetical protein
LSGIRVVIIRVVIIRVVIIGVVIIRVVIAQLIFSRYKNSRKFHPGNEIHTPSLKNFAEKVIPINKRDIALVI